jgi:Domain of unknown function (DUF4129)
VVTLLFGLAAAAGGPVSGDAARRAAQSELDKPEYHADDPGYLERAVHWIGRTLGHLLSAGSGSHALLIALVVLAGLAVVFALRAGVPRRRASAGAGVDADPLAPVAARDHRRLAAQYAADGRHREALREWLRAAVATIEERGVLPPRPGRTGAATAREAGPLLPEAADALATATGVFDEVWFGGRAATGADVRAAQAAADAVRAARLVLPREPVGTR